MSGEITNDNLVEIARTCKCYLKVKSPRDERVLAAMSKVDRIDFLPLEVRDKAYIDEPVGIGYDATCSEPSCVALMDDMLEIQEGQKILEVGLGCGYHAAITYRLVRGNGGRLITLEVDPRLEDMGRRNLKRHFGSLKGIEIFLSDGSLGYLDEAPFDRIYMTAAPNIQRGTFRRDILTNQLSDGGILLFPEKSEYALCHYRKSGGQIYETIHKGIVRFVGLKGLNV